jgi:ribose 1,5-bisphosphokinase
MTLEPRPRTTPPGLIGPGRLVLIVGPSGAGKDTLIAHAKAACVALPAIVFPRRVVTRQASDAEDHDTLAAADFDHAVKNGLFAFWWEAHGHKYGIPSSANDDIRVGRVVVSNVSRGIVADIRERYAHVDVVLVTAPTDVLAFRLARRSRNTDGPVIERINRNNSFSTFSADYVIETTDTHEAAVQQLLDVIGAPFTDPCQRRTGL